VVGELSEQISNQIFEKKRFCGGKSKDVSVVICEFEKER